MKNRKIKGDKIVLLIICVLAISVFSLAPSSAPESEKGLSCLQTIKTDTLKPAGNKGVFSTSQKEPKLLTALTGALKETSGLAIINAYLLTHNDSGGKNELYSFGLDGEVTHTFSITGARNKDWEELAQSETDLFIGDIGNNNGNRKDLKIYIVDKASFDFSRNYLEVPVKGIIEFNYPEQLEFNKGKKHNFDCEAIIYFKSHLYLFTKHRLDGNTVLYKLPATSGQFDAEKIDQFNAGVRITGADIRQDHQEVILIGYNKDKDCVLWKLSSFHDDNFLSGEKEQISLGPFLTLGQMESVLYVDHHTLYITSEEVGTLPPRLYSVTL